jgi:hypothetical protein
LRHFIKLLSSLDTGIIILVLLLICFIAGAIIMPSSELFEALYVIPLFYWLKESPFGLSWWLFLAIILTGLLVLNTVVCSLQSISKKSERKNFLLIISPQIMHLGFILIVIGHLSSSYGGSRQLFQIREGSWFEMADNSIAEVKEIILKQDSSGYITDMALKILHHSQRGREEYSVRPNRPFIYKGTGLYIKTSTLYPMKMALIEISHEPGAIPALAGALLFGGGNVILLILKIKKELALNRFSAKLSGII